MSSKCVLISFVAAFAGQMVQGQECARDAMVVFDGSGSMSEMGFNQLDEPRIFEARRALREVLPQVEDVRRIGLITYGPSKGESCESVELRFEPIEKAAIPIITTVESLQPAGETPLTDAVRRAAEVLVRKGGAGDVVLVTDGKETCGGAPCQLAATLAADYPNIQVHVIGYKIRGDRFDWDKSGVNDYTDANTPAQCLSETTGGEYHSAETAEQLVGALQATLGCPLYGSLLPLLRRDPS